MNTAPTLAQVVETFGPRILTLSDGRRGLRGSIHITAAPPPSDPSIHQSTNPPILDFVASDDTLDRYQEIISPAGWQLASYQRNPVFQNSHQYGDILFTLGRALTTEVRVVSGRQALFQRIEFATEANPVARIAYALYAGKFLNTVSVGFIPLRWEDGDVSQSSSSSSSSSSSVPFRRRYLEQELLEVSAVAIPANPNALALAYKSGAVQKSDLKETADLLRQLTASTDHIHPTSPTPNPHPLLSLARELATILHRA